MKIKILFISLTSVLIFLSPCWVSADITLVQELTSSPGENFKKPELEEQVDEGTGTLQDLEEELKDLKQKLATAKNEAQKNRMKRDIQELEQLITERKQAIERSKSQEGEVAQAKEEVTLYISGNKLRFESGGIVSIVDMDKRRLLNLVPQGKIYYELSFEEWEKLQKRADEAAARLPADKQKDLLPRNIKVTRTGNRQMVNGLNCEQYIITDQLGSEEVWVTKDVEFKEYNALMKKYSELMMRENPEIQRELEKLQVIEGLPIKVISKSPYSMEVTEVKKILTNKLDPALFEVPKGFQKRGPEKTPR